MITGDGYDYVKQEPIKLYPYSTVEIFLLYNGGGWVISENRDLNKYIDNIYLNSQVETKIGDDVQTNNTIFMVYFFCAFFFLCYLCYVKNESNQLCEHEKL